MSDPETRSGQQGGERTPVVFFVDDEEGVRNTWSQILRKHGYRVLVAATAEEAIWFVEAFSAPIDVLLMDINLPDGWGSSVAQGLRAVHPEMSVVYTTGYAESDPILSGALEDARYVVRKPASAAELLRVIGEAADAARAGG
jgi:two-component system cell cycle sensor histidine kinase/response regulator CckA